MITHDKHGTVGNMYICPSCGGEHGSVIHHITEQSPILCNKCLNDDATDINLRFKTILYYMKLLHQTVDSLSHTTSGLRRLI